MLVAAFALVVAIALGSRPWAAVALAGALGAVVPMRAVITGAQGGALIPVLGRTGQVQLATGLLAALGIALGG
jgi:1,4-dihydroxy-2-naphthoate octaprenyltransferase